MGKTERVLLAVFVGLLVLDLGLFSLYKARKQESPRPPPSPIEGENPHLPSPVTIIPGDPARGTLEAAEIEGVIRSEPFWDEQGQAVVAVAFPRQGSNKVTTQVVLGSQDERILTLYAEGLQVGSVQEWRARPVAEILPHLKRGDPIRVRFYLQRPPPHWLSDPRCNDSCKRRLEKAERFFEANTRLVETINAGGKQPGEPFQIGAISALVVSASE